MASVLQTDASHHGSIVSYEIPEIKKGDLQCLKKLGEGGYGEVYKAHHVPWSEEIAVKVCKKHLSDDDKKIALREIQRMIKTTSNEHIISIKGIVTNVSPYSCCIVMDYMEHGSLKSFQDKLKPFPNAVKVEMIKEITLGMKFLHTLKEPIIHRDLKLENILVNSRLKVKISDFGLATWCTATNRKEAGGTITHIPPEHLEDINAEVTTKFDVYSFGITLWHLASRRQPYENCLGNDAFLKVCVTTGQRPAMKLIPDDEPDIIKQLIEKSWHQDPDKRPDFQEITRKVHDEFLKNYKKDVNKGRADIFVQLGNVSSNQDDADESCLFPWQQNSGPDLPVLTHIDARSRAFDLPSPAPSNDSPLTLQSIDPITRQKSKDLSFPVAVSDPHAEGQQDGASVIETKMTGMNINSDKYGVPDTTPHKQATPTGCNGSVSNMSEDAAGISTGQVHCMNSDAASQQPESSATIQPQAQNSGFSEQSVLLQPGQQQHPEQPLQQPLTHQEQPLSQRQSYSDSVSSSIPQNVLSPHAAKPERTYSNANPININVKGDGNVVSVAQRGGVIHMGKPGKKNKKKSKRKKPTPPPSSSSSSSSSASDSDETDSVAGGAHATPLTNSNEPVTETDIRDISEHIGKQSGALGGKLGLKQALIENIFLDYDKYGQQEIAFQIMLKWIRSKSTAATKAALAKALYKVGLRDVADKL
ncbi:serine/threonine-protein kinase fray1-like isoform X2 [Patiria miniata]|uniref:Uncharacterized protein n=1 Tax=Patiria miniata TaxID=46514 RepID=A0A914AA10_PATMI|nr:serine/threonine-protein kinase fray1-like isoform X2 [Patiria miniata]